MLLREMFSPIGSPSEEPEVDWISDLKFFIDNDDQMLNQYFFPAVKKHKENKGHPDAYKIYIRPVEGCLENYCNKFNVEEKEKKFTKDKIIELAKQFAKEQEKHINSGDYEA